jgi:hypothetical protein
LRPPATRSLHGSSGRSIWPEAAGDHHHPVIKDRHGAGKGYVTVLETKTQKKTNRRVKDTRAPRQPVWRPEPIGLTREEVRAIVADMLG